MAYADALENHARRRAQLELGLPADSLDREREAGWRSPDGPEVRLRLLLDLRILQVWSRASTDLRGTPAVLRELNAWNLATPHVRAVYDDGEVIVLADLDLESMAAGQLDRIVGIVARAAAGLGDALSLTIGAQRPWTPLTLGSTTSGGSDD